MKPTLYIQVPEEELEQKIKEKLILQKEFVSRILSSINFHLRKYLPVYYTQGMLDQNIVSKDEMTSFDEDFYQSQMKEMIELMESRNEEQNNILNHYKHIKYYREDEKKED